MPLPADLLEQARQYRMDAVQRLLMENYPRVHRLAYGLSGQENVGRLIVRQVMRQGLRQIPTWHTEGEPQRWFDHHTILLWRRTAAHAPDPQRDLLAAADPAPAYTAFIRAVRRLPPQQREAFLLHVGEGYDDRQSGIAMDCSRTAAANHLAAARGDLAAVCGGEAERDRHARTLHAAWAALTTESQILLPALQRAIRRRVWGRRLRRATRLLLIFLLLAVIAAGCWWFVGGVR
jgi:DNA-directed RNA polymerase specialized sigma24 family protein